MSETTHIMTQHHKKGKAVPLQAWSGPEEVKVPRFHDNGTG